MGVNPLLNLIGEGAEEEEEDDGDDGPDSPEISNPGLVSDRMHRIDPKSDIPDKSTWKPTCDISDKKFT